MPAFLLCLQSHLAQKIIGWWEPNHKIEKTARWDVSVMDKIISAGQFGLSFVTWCCYVCAAFGHATSTRRSADVWWKGNLYLRQRADQSANLIEFCERVDVVIRDTPERMKGGKSELLFRVGDVFGLDLVSHLFQKCPLVFWAGRKIIFPKNASLNEQIWN